MFDEFQALIAAGKSPRDILKELANRKGYDLDTAHKQGKTLGQVLQEMSAMPELETGILSAIPAAYTGLARGIVSELPKTVGTALQLGGRAGVPIISPAMEWVGKGLETAGEAAGQWIKERQPRYGGIPQIIEEGLAMLAPSLASIPVGGALAKAIQGAKVMSPLASQVVGRATAPFALFGASAAEEALREAEAKGLPDADARMHAAERAIIEGAGETLGTYMLGRILNVPAKLATESGVTGLKKIAASPLARALAVEPTTEVAQETLHGLSRQRYGLTDKSFSEIVDESLGVFFPSVVMTLATFGLAKAAHIKPKSLEDISADLDKLSKTEFTPKYPVWDVANNVAAPYRNFYQGLSKVAPNQIVGVSEDGKLEPVIATVTKAFPKQWNELNPIERDLIIQAYNTTFSGLLNEDQMARLHDYVVAETIKATQAREEKEFYDKAQAEYDKAQAEYEQAFADLVREENERKAAEKEKADEEARISAEQKQQLYFALQQLAGQKEAYLSSPEYFAKLRQELTSSIQQLTPEDFAELSEAVKTLPPEIAGMYNDIVSEISVDLQRQKDDIATAMQSLTFEQAQEMLSAVNEDANLSPLIKDIYHTVFEENMKTYMQNSMDRTAETVQAVPEEQLERFLLSTVANRELSDKVKDAYFAEVLRRIAPAEKVELYLQMFEMPQDLANLTSKQLSAYINRPISTSKAEQIINEAKLRYVRAAINNFAEEKIIKPNISAEEVPQVLRSIPLPDLQPVIGELLRNPNISNEVKTELNRIDKELAKHKGQIREDIPSINISKKVVSLPKVHMKWKGKIDKKHTLEDDSSGDVQKSVETKLIDTIRTLYALAVGNTAETVGETKLGKQTAGELAQAKLGTKSERVDKFKVWTPKYTLSAELTDRIRVFSNYLKKNYEVIRLGTESYPVKNFTNMIENILDKDEDSSYKKGQLDVMWAFRDLASETGEGKTLYLKSMLKELFDIAAVDTGVPEAQKGKPSIAALLSPPVKVTTKEVTPQIIIEKLDQQLKDNTNSALNILDEVVKQINKNLSDLSEQAIPILIEAHDRHRELFEESEASLKEDKKALQKKLKELKAELKKLEAEQAKKDKKKKPKEETKEETKKEGKKKTPEKRTVIDKNKEQQEAVSAELARVEEQLKEIELQVKNWEAVESKLELLQMVKEHISTSLVDLSSFRKDFKETIQQAVPSPTSDKNYLSGFIFKSISNLLTLERNMANLYIEWRNHELKLEKNYIRLSGLKAYTQELLNDFSNALTEHFEASRAISGKKTLIRLDHAADVLADLSVSIGQLREIANKALSKFEDDIVAMQIKEQPNVEGKFTSTQFIREILATYREFLSDPVYTIGNQLLAMEASAKTKTVTMVNIPKLGTAVANDKYILVSKEGSSQIRGYALQPDEVGKPIDKTVAEKYINTKDKSAPITTVLDSLNINSRIRELADTDVYSELDKLLHGVVRPLLRNKDIDTTIVSWAKSRANELTEAWNKTKESKTKEKSKANIKNLIAAAISETTKTKTDTEVSKEIDEEIDEEIGTKKYTVADINNIINEIKKEDEKTTKTEPKVDLSAKPNTEVGWITSLFRSWFFKNANLGLPSTAQHLNSPVDKFLERYATKLLGDMPIRVDFINKDTVVSRLLDEGVSENAIRQALFLHGYSEADIDARGLNELLVETFFGATVSGENMIPLIFISDTLTPINQIKAGLHELLEVYLKAFPFSESEMRIAERTYGKLWKEGFVDDAVSYILNSDGINPINKSAFRKAFDWIRKFAHRLANFVRGDGFKSAEDIMQSIHTGTRVTTVEEPTRSLQAVVDFALADSNIAVKKERLSVMDILKASNNAFNRYVTDTKLSYFEKNLLPPQWSENPVVQRTYEIMDNAIGVRNEIMTDLYASIGELLEKSKKNNPNGYKLLDTALQVSDWANKPFDDEVLRKVFGLEAAEIEVYKAIKALFDNAADTLYKYLRMYSLKYSVTVDMTDPRYAKYSRIFEKTFNTPTFKALLDEIGAIRKNKQVIFDDIDKLESVIGFRPNNATIAELETWLTAQDADMRRTDDMLYEMKRGFYFPRIRPSGNYHLAVYEWHTFKYEKEEGKPDDLPTEETKLVETFRFISEPSMLKLKELLNSELKKNELLRGKSHIEVHIPKDTTAPINVETYKKLIKDKDIVITDEESADVIKGILNRNQKLIVTETKEKMPYAFYEKLSRHTVLSHLQTFFSRLKTDGSAFTLFTNLSEELQDVIKAKLDPTNPHSIMAELPNIRKQGIAKYFDVTNQADIETINTWIKMAEKSAASEGMWMEFMRDLKNQIDEELKGRSLALSRTIQRKSHKTANLDRILKADVLTMQDAEFISNLAKDANVVRGYNTDALEVVRDYVVGLSEFISRLTAQDELKDLRKIPEYTTALSKDANLFDWLTKYTAAIMYPGGHVSRFVQQAKSAATLWFLGGRFSSAFIQLTQLPVVAGPELGGFVNATDLDLIEYRPVKQSVGELFASQGRALAKIGKAFYDVMLNNITLEEKTALDDAIRKGITMAQFYNDLIGDYHKWMPSAFRQFTKYAMWMFMNAEIKTREAAFVAGYRLAIEKGLDQADAITFATTYVDKSLFKYGKHAKPLIALGEDGFSAVASLALTLKGYQMNYVSWLYDSLRKKHGHRQAEKAALSFIYIMALGGLFAVPLLGELLDIFSKIFGYPIKEKFLNMITKNPTVKSGFAYGMLTPLTGVDISPSMRLEVIPRDLSMSGIADFVFGVWSGSENKITKATTLYKAGQYDKALIALAPAVVEPVVRGGKVLLGEQGLQIYKGDTTLKNVYGKTLVDPYSGQPIRLSLTEGTLSLLGFRPVTLSKATDVHLATRTIQNYYMRQKANIYNKLKHADTIEEIMNTISNDVNNYNKRVMRYGGAIPFITGDSIAEVLKNSKGEPNKLAPFL